MSPLSARFQRITHIHSGRPAQGESWLGFKGAVCPYCSVISSYKLKLTLKVQSSTNALPRYPPSASSDRLLLPHTGNLPHWHSSEAGQHSILTVASTNREDLICLFCLCFACFQCSLFWTAGAWCLYVDFTHDVIGIFSFILYMYIHIYVYIHKISLQHRQ